LWSPMPCRRRRAVCIVLAAWPYGGGGAGCPAIRLDPADRHINAERGAYMFRVVAALLLAAAVLAAVDLGGLVDMVYYTTSPLKRFAPTYVFEVDGCRVLVYVVNSTLKNSPLEAWKNLAEQLKLASVYYTRAKELRPLTSAEVEKLLDALFQALGPSAEVGIGVWTMYTLCYEPAEDAQWGIVAKRVHAPCGSVLYEYLRVETRNVTQLAEEARRAAGVDFYLGAADAREYLLKNYEESKGAITQAAFLSLVEWRRGDPIVYFIQDTSSVRLEVWTANLSAAAEALRKAKEATGKAWNSVIVELWHGPYLISSDEARALTEAARVLEKELREVWESNGEEEWVRRIWWDVYISFEKELGPLYVVIPYPNGTAPDKATAERLVRRFVELSGFCKSPLVVEFWPGPELKPPSTEYSVDQPPPLWPYVAAIATVAAITIGIIVLTARRR